MKRFSFLVLALTTLLGAEESKQFVYHHPQPCNWTPPCDERTWTMTVSSGLSYRFDTQKFDSTLFTTYLHSFNSLQLYTNVLFAWKRVRMWLSSSYGWMLTGSLSQKDSIAPFQPTKSPFSSFSLSNGYTADLQPMFGCRINYWTICSHEFFFTPAIGLNYSHLKTYPQGQKRAPLQATNGYSMVSYTRPIQEDSWGPVVEGRLTYSWHKEWNLDLFYQYTHVYFSQTFEESVSNYYQDGGGTLIGMDSTKVRVASHGDTLRTQLGGFDCSYRSPYNWQLGTHFEASSTWSKTAKSVIHNLQDAFGLGHTHTSTSTKEPLSVNWTRYLLNFYGSYWF
jgi:hypothetical protein